MNFLGKYFNIQTVQKLLEQKDLKTTMVYTHVLNRGPAGVRSPVEDDYADPHLSADQAGNTP